MKKITILIIFLFVFTGLHSINYITTAESISWSGSFTSVSDGFESMLYNPAGLYMTNRKFGLNILGTYGFRFYNNTFSTDHILQIFKSKDGNITNFISERLNAMTDMGFDTGVDLSLFNVMFYVKYQNFSFGFSFLPKTYLKATIGKSFLEAFTKKLDLTNPLSIKISSTFLQYFDLNFNLSTRAKFIEKVIPVESIFVGMTGHFYLPTVLLNITGNGTIKSGSPNDMGLYTYDIDLKGDLNIGGVVPHALSATGLNLGNETINSIISKCQTTGFGLGLDLGFIVKFNKIVKLGFSATDLGFIAIPTSTKAGINLAKKLDFSNIEDFTKTFATDLLDSLGNVTNNTTYAYMMPMAFRCGVAITPIINNKYLDLLITADVSISDINRAVNLEYPSFNFATGVELAPKVKWFSLPIRVAFNYNTEANAPSFSFGTGLYMGPVEMEIGVKGLEVLISGLGAKEVVVGFDFKFEF